MKNVLWWNFHQTHKTVISVKGTQQAEKTRQRLMPCLMKQEQFCNCSDIWEGKDVVKVTSAFPFLSCTYWSWLIVVSDAYQVCRYQKSLALPKKSPSAVPSFIHDWVYWENLKVRQLFCAWGSLEDSVKIAFHEESRKKITLHHRILPWHKLLSKTLKIFTLKILSEKGNFPQEILVVRLFTLWWCWWVSFLLLLFLHLFFIGQLKESPHRPVCGSKHWCLIQKITAVSFFL